MMLHTIFCLFGLASIGKVASQTPMRLYLDYFSVPNLDLDNLYTDKLRTAVLGFGQGKILNTEIYHLSRDGSFCADDTTGTCDVNCYNDNRYCALKTPSDANPEFDGVTGQFYLDESVRRMCLWRRLRFGHSSKSYQYWDYIHQVVERGCMQTMNTTCVEQVQLDVVGEVINCYGNYHKLGMNRNNPVKWLEESKAAAQELDVTLTMVPELYLQNQSIPLDVFVNGDEKDLVQYMCDYWASPDGGQIVPPACLNCMNCDHTSDHFVECLSTGGKCSDPEEEIAKFTATPTSTPYPSTSPPTATPVAPTAPVFVPTDAPSVATVIDDLPPTSSGGGNGTTTVEPTIPVVTTSPTVPDNNSTPSPTTTIGSPVVAPTSTVPDNNTPSPTTPNPTPQPTLATASGSLTASPTLPSSKSSSSSQGGVIVGVLLAVIVVVAVFLSGFIRRMSIGQEPLTEEDLAAADGDLALQDTPIVPSPPTEAFTNFDADLAPIEEGYADAAEGEEESGTGYLPPVT